MPWKERTNRQWLLKARPQGFIKASDFEQKSAAIPALQHGQVLAKVLYLSFDPVMRGWVERDTHIAAVPLGGIMRSFGVAQVVESKHVSFVVGDIVSGLVGWQEFILFDGADPKPLWISKIPGHLDPLQVLTLSMTGLAAYFGMTKVGQIKEGDAVLVSGAAGSTGSIAGQVARLLGASKVVGIAGGPEKCTWVTEKAKFDCSIDYKNDNVGSRIKELFPDGVDIYFDNVGGPILDYALDNLATHARIVGCGAISQYNLPPSERYGIKNLLNLTLNRATMTGLFYLDYVSESMEGLFTLLEWVENKEMVLQIDEQKGFENIPSTLVRLFAGANTGKQVLKLADPPLPQNTNIVE